MKIIECMEIINEKVEELEKNYKYTKCDRRREEIDISKEIFKYIWVMNCIAVDRQNSR